MRVLTAAILATVVATSVQCAAEPHLRVRGTDFIRPDGAVFEWRGITAFRLLEFVADGQEAQAEAYLRWAARKQLNVVRVLAIADGIFQLSPADGERALPRLLALARRHGMYVEVVALTGTSVIPLDAPRFVKAIGAICARYPNALIEIANEPGHPTQSADVHKPAYLASLAALVPKEVPVALGSVEYGDGFGTAGTYATWHAPRTADWPRRIAEGRALEQKFGKPLVSDEPIGAGEAVIPGRRDNVPARFREAAVETRRAGVGATFHYDGGVQARLPGPAEEACLDAWLAGLNER